MDYPKSWRWDEDGLVVDGTYVGTSSAPGEYGDIPILTLKVAGEDRAVWVTQIAIRSKLADELNRRKVRNFESGERIVIKRADEKKKSASGRSYWPFSCEFPDASPRDAAALLGVDAVPVRSASSEDDIPF
jgi:hypothetical protein